MYRCICDNKTTATIFTTIATLIDNLWKPNPSSITILIFTEKDHSDIAFVHICTKQTKFPTTGGQDFYLWAYLLLYSAL